MEIRSKQATVVAQVFSKHGCPGRRKSRERDHSEFADENELARDVPRQFAHLEIRWGVLSWSSRPYGISKTPREFRYTRAKRRS